jgi:serine/threonine protein kinase
MKDWRWQEIERLYNSVLERKPEDRVAYLREACDDESLRKEVESLLACQSEAKGFIESPALEAAAQDLARNQSSPASAALAGRTLSHYKVIEKLGEGGMGVVYKALDTRLNRPVALKVLPPDRVSDPERKRRFVKEARAASALNHPNIVTIHDIGQAEGVDFIAMEYVAGKTLDRRIGRKGLPIGETLKCAAQIADALAAAHSAGIVHRDLKPSVCRACRPGCPGRSPRPSIRRDDPQNAPALLQVRSQAPGLVMPDGSFLPIPRPDPVEIMMMFRHRLLKSLLAQEKIPQRLIDILLSWRHPGFSVFQGEPVSPDDHEARERLARYCVHPPIALERLRLHALLRSECGVQRRRGFHPA